MDVARPLKCAKMGFKQMTSQRKCTKERPDPRRFKTLSFSIPSRFIPALSLTPKDFSMWLADGGVKPGIVHGTTDDFGYIITENPPHVHDLPAFLLHLMGIDHTR
jgi:hypothetical protein